MNSRSLGKSLGALAVPLGVVMIIMLLVVPVPTWLLDILISVSILFALVILLTTMFARRPLDFSVFPSLLLVATLFRLGLNVASTRLVLSDGYAGQVIQAFGHVAIGGSLIIGAVIFLILVVIQFVVVTKGAERVAEVGARFTLDAMPGKQMAIDADLNAGLITEDEARARRADVSAEADFYGAMDGASKFVKGDAIAGIIIIVINLIGGIAIGVLSQGKSIEDAVNTYSLLTIGDGLATQIPALLMAVATGMIVTRSNSDSDMAADSWKQLSQSSKGLLIAGIAAIGLALVPGMPPLTFLLIGGGLILASRAVTRKSKADALAKAREGEQAAISPSADTPEELMEQMRVHALEVQLAPDLVDLVSGADDDLLGRVKALRRRIAMEYGVVIPPVRTRDQIELPPATYVIRIAGAEVGRGTAPVGRVLALGEDLDSLPGEVVIEPVFGLHGKWIPAELRYSAELTGATVVDRGSMIITHLSSLIVENAARLLSREDVRVLTEGVKQVSPALVDELIPNLLSLSEVHRVLQGLLAEKLPINDLPRIYEALTLRAKVSNDPEGLVEAARVGLGPAVVAPHVVDRALRVIMIDPMLEHEMLEALRPSEYGSQVLFDQVKAQAVLTSLQNSVTGAEQLGVTPVLVCAPALRPAVRRMVSAQTGGIAVLSYNEVTSMDVAIETVGVVRAHDSIAV